MSKPKLTEQYLAECLENHITRHRKNDPTMSFHRNVRIGYTPAFRNTPQNEADIIVYFGGWFHEVEVKVNLKDLKRDIRAIFLALERKSDSSKAKKIFNIIHGVSFVDTYSILCPSYNYNQLSDATKSMIRQHGIGVICYMGDGKVETIEKAKRIKKAMAYDKLELITYFNRPTVNARSIKAKAKKPRRKGSKRNRYGK